MFLSILKMGCSRYSQILFVSKLEAASFILKINFVLYQKTAASIITNITFLSIIKVGRLMLILI